MPRALIFANFSAATEKTLSKICSANLGATNPLAIAADADAEFFAQALTACLNDDNVDGVVITPLSDSSQRHAAYDPTSGQRRENIFQTGHCLLGRSLCRKPDAFEL